MRSGPTAASPVLRRARALALLALAAVAVLAWAPSAAQAEPSAQQDVFSTLGASSPFCGYGGLPASTVDACRRSGSIAHAYPLSRYELDLNVASDKSLLEIKPFDVIAIAAQNGGSFWWSALVYAFKAILLLLEWAFSLSLLAECAAGSAQRSCHNAMPQVASALRNLNQNVFGTPWLIAAFAGAGLWGIWNGLVRQRVTETFAGLAGTVGLVTLGLVIVGNPAGTVGELARISNNAALGVLSVAASGRADTSAGSFARAQEGLFDTLIGQPWCALQFGDVEYCMKGERGRRVADVWLAYEPGGWERQALYKLTRGEAPGGRPGTYDDRGYAGDPGRSHGVEPGRWRSGGTQDQGPTGGQLKDQLHAAAGDDPTPEKVRLQEAAGTTTRLALMGLVGVTLVGAGLVLSWIALRLLMSTIALLILLLLSPVVLLAAALGEAGRSACLSYAKQVAAAAAAKLLFAFVLSVLVLVGGILAGLALGWFTIWLLQLAFWWGVLLRHRQLLAFARLDLAGATQGDTGRGGGGGFMQAYFGMRAVREIGGELVGAATAPVRAMRAHAVTARHAEATALKRSLGRDLHGRARSALALRRDADRQRAQGLQGRKGDLERQLAGVRRVRGDLEGRLRAGEGEGSMGRLRRLQDKHAALRASQQQQAGAWSRAWRERARVRSEQALVEQMRDRALASGKHDLAKGYAERLRGLAAEDAALGERLGTARDALKFGRAEMADLDHAIVATRDGGLTDDGRFEPGANAYEVARSHDIAELERLKQEETRLENELRSPEIRWAEGFLVQDAAGEPPSDADVRRWIEERRAAADQGTATAEEARLFALHDSEQLPRDVHDAAAAAAARRDPQYAGDVARRSEELREQARIDRIMRRRYRR